jgi:hypothetical protein
MISSPQILSSSSFILAFDVLATGSILKVNPPHPTPPQEEGKKKHCAFDFSRYISIVFGHLNLVVRPQRVCLRDALKLES